MNLPDFNIFELQKKKTGIDKGKFPHVPYNLMKSVPMYLN
ncbi:hypothetical protein LEP1GSC133_5179 [Leptospira borgpetersenii serovar Pomona str. 200901868]|uniref:Uncharacterized protein n=1 Tax=Leptospira borgpetersenii serovar Pomona str. 200901868 TaxID=1192866 RepID=M6VTP9_LEPBO|nr:hypothetical protein LEP1GSC133_5179 [Leptospira borgpetersenii serovar Pomona str. 200901868]